MTELQLNNVSVEIEGAALLKSISATLKSNELVALIGPNGAGKTTLLKCALGLLAPASGAITIDQKPLADFSPIERARAISYLPQMRPLVWPLLVRDIVALGRYAYGAASGKLSGADEKAVEAAIENCNLAAFADRRADTLSGGELARVHCARAFAAQAPLLLADEPVAALDPAHQFQLMMLIRNYVDQGRGAIVVLHDLSLAAKFADRLIWMKDGVIETTGTPSETLTKDLLRRIFSIDADISLNESACLLSVKGTL